MTVGTKKSQLFLRPHLFIIHKRESQRSGMAIYHDERVSQKIA